MMLDFIKALSKLLLTSFFLLLISDLMIAQAGAEGAQDEIILDWDKLRSAVKKYNLKPNEDNARAILESIPEKMPGKQVGDDERALDYVLDKSPIIKKQIESGNEYLAEAAFRMYFIVLPGDALEELTLMLCKMLEKKPELYLSLLKKYKPQFPWYLEYPLLMTEFDEKFDADPDGRIRRDIKIYRRRIKALETVDCPEYLDLRNECIKILEKEIKLFESKLKIELTS